MTTCSIWAGHPGKGYRGLTRACLKKNSNERTRGGGFQPLPQHQGIEEINVGVHGHNILKPSGTSKVDKMNFPLK
jgi:hypothetical protein